MLKLDFNQQSQTSNKQLIIIVIKFYNNLQISGIKHSLIANQYCNKLKQHKIDIVEYSNKLYKINFNKDLNNNFNKQFNNFVGNVVKILMIIYIKELIN